ncbi:peptidylprolyl [Perkinsus olseni]|uniref:Peptidyl-prolyl cis-trans isomerase n=1 Tax=Perkinsus olseni TaxID=32597 RepID=A0A7J6MDH1_PEROL|nr:peptidylprolyl [Perkinsus olseni]KAF4674870.1 peptidylprolyl [Perkinsus olseni]
MTVTLNTTHGVLKINLYLNEAPKACRNFVELCRHGYYDGCIFHRVIKGSLCQTGDPDPFGTALGGSTTARGNSQMVLPKGGESIYGAPFPDEICSHLSHDRKGVVSMANTGFNTNCSQFFITLARQDHLDGRHTIFGSVPESSWHVLSDIEAVKCRKQCPCKPVKIFTATIDVDPWENESLPPGCKIPDRPLIAGDVPARDCTLM